jgi:hypothetical protein
MILPADFSLTVLGILTLFIINKKAQIFLRALLFLLTLSQYIFANNLHNEYELSIHSGTVIAAIIFSLGTVSIVSYVVGLTGILGWPKQLTSLRSSILPVAITGFAST